MAAGLALSSTFPTPGKADSAPGRLAWELLDGDAKLPRPRGARSRLGAQRVSSDVDVVPAAGGWPPSAGPTSVVADPRSHPLARIDATGRVQGGRRDRSNRPAPRPARRPGRRPGRRQLLAWGAGPRERPSPARAPGWSRDPSGPRPQGGAALATASRYGGSRSRRPRSSRSTPAPPRSWRPPTRGSPSWSPRVRATRTSSAPELTPFPSRRATAPSPRCSCGSPRRPARSRSCRPSRSCSAPTSPPRRSHGGSAATATTAPPWQPTAARRPRSTPSTSRSAPRPSPLRSLPRRRPIRRA